MCGPLALLRPTRAKSVDPGVVLGLLWHCHRISQSYRAWRRSKLNLWPRATSDQGMAYHGIPLHLTDKCRLQLGFLAELWYIATLLILKIAIGLFFLRLALDRWKRILIYVILGSLVIFSVGSILYNIFHCGPFKSFLEFLFRKVAGQCAPDSVTLAMTYTHASLTALTDWTFAFMPVLILRASLMTGKEKVVVGSLMGFASVSGVASLVRFKFVASIVEPTENVFGKYIHAPIQHSSHDSDLEFLLAI
jgi:hypothetical protein